MTLIHIPILYTGTLLHNLERVCCSHLQHLDMNDRGKDRHHRSVLSEYPTCMQNTNRSNQQATPTLQNYDLLSTNEDRHYTPALGKYLACKDIYTAPAAHVLHTPRQGASSYNSGSKQQSHIPECSRDTCFKPYTTIDLIANQPARFQNTYDTLTQVSLPIMSIPNTERHDQSVGRQYGIPFLEKKAVREDYTHTHKKYGQPKT